MSDPGFRLPHTNQDPEAAHLLVSSACKGIGDVLPLWKYPPGGRTVERFVVDLRLACQASPVPPKSHLALLRQMRTPMNNQIRRVWLEWCDWAPIIFGPDADPADPIPLIDWLVAGFDPARAGLYIQARVPMGQALPLELAAEGPPDWQSLRLLAALNDKVI